MESTDDAQAKELLADLDRKIDEVRVLVYQLTNLNLNTEHQEGLATLLQAMYHTSMK